MMEWGTKPEIELKEVNKDYDVQPGQIYAYKGVFYRDWFRSEKSYLDETVGAIVTKGDEPIYAKVEFTGFLYTHVEIYFIAKHKGKTAISTIIKGILVVLGLAVTAYIIHEVYYVATGKPIPPPKIPTAVGIGGIALILLLIYLLTRERK